MNFEVEMEYRSCKNCRSQFRVMTKSQQSVCSTACDSYGPAVLGGRQRQSRGGGSRSGSEVVAVTVRTPRTDSGHKQGAVLNTWPTTKKRRNVGGSTMQQTRNGSTSEGPNGPATTESTKTPTTGLTIGQTRRGAPPTSALAGTGESHTEASDGLPSRLSVASLDIMSTSKRCADKLMAILEATVREGDVDKVNDGAQRFSVVDIDSAVRIANAITGIVQSNVNLLKAINK